MLLHVCDIIFFLTQTNRDKTWAPLCWAHLSTTRQQLKLTSSMVKCITTDCRPVGPLLEWPVHHKWPSLLWFWKLCGSYQLQHTWLSRTLDTALSKHILFSIVPAYLSRLQFTVGSSILLISTMRCLTPAVLASMACSLVCPPFSKPVSNSPFLAEITWYKTNRNV